MPELSFNVRDCLTLSCCRLGTARWHTALSRSRTIAVQQQPDGLGASLQDFALSSGAADHLQQAAQQGAEDEPMEISGGGLDPRMVQAAEAVGIDPAFLEALPADLRSEVC